MLYREPIVADLVSFTAGMDRPVAHKPSLTIPSKLEHLNHLRHLHLTYRRYVGPPLHADILASGMWNLAEHRLADKMLRLERRKRYLVRLAECERLRLRLEKTGLQHSTSQLKTLTVGRWLCHRWDEVETQIYEGHQIAALEMRMRINHLALPILQR
jgi:hypothetical protein